MKLNNKLIDKTYFIKNEYNDSQVNAYSCNFINGIVDSGSNANGDYVKYLDGTMICYKTISGRIDVNTAWGSLYMSSEIALGNYAEPFISKPTVNVAIDNISGTQTMLSGGTTSPSSETTGPNVCLIRPNSRTDLAYRLGMIAIGKWK